MLATSCLPCSSTRRILFFNFLLLLFPHFARPLSFDITSFSPEDTMLYEGAAKPSNGAIELNPALDIIWYVGHASYGKPMRLWDSSTRKLADFVSHFSFTVINVSSTFGDGFAFFLAPVDYAIPPNSIGMFLGLFNYSTSQNRVVPLVSIEFDSYVNPEWDPSVKHVGINNCSIVSDTYAPWDVESTSGKEANVWVTYNATTKNLSVFWTYESNPIFMGNSTLSYNIDLMDTLPEWVRIGFSAATALERQHNIINSWQFNSSLDSSWEFESNKGNKSKKSLAVVGAIGFSLLLLVASGLTYFVFKRMRRAKNNVSSNGNAEGMIADTSANLERGSFPKRFSYQELVLATNNFTDHMKLGHGGSGHVYKGVLNDLGRVVAVKRIFTEYVNSEKIFINEVQIISRLIHRNLVQFIGWCHEEGKSLLVYEYMPNGSLDTHLFGNRRTLPWDVRFRIASCLASAIRYLHEEAEHCVLHRDIKSANVLLDADFVCKLGDFGVAKLVDPRLRTQTTGIVGTYGYLAPEYANEGRASKESDIFSFGVVALEIACGRMAFKEEGEEYYVPLAKWVWQLYIAGNILNAADERLNMEFDKDEMECLLKVGLWCAHPKDKERPKAGQVIKVLQFEAPLPQLPIDYGVPDLICSLSPPHYSENESVVPIMTSSLNNQGGR